MGSLYAKDVIGVAKSYIGYHENGNNWTVFAQVLDDCDYFDPQKKQNVAWCGIFCDFCCLEAAQPSDRDNESKKYDAQYFLYQPSYNNYSASAALFATYFKNAGAFYDEPEKGDMIFFKMSDSNIGHVGIVEDTNGCITTIEGNAGDQVQRKWYDYGDSRIAGFGRPRYDGYEPSPTPTPPEPTKKITVELDELKRGSTGGQVNTLKALLNEFGWSDSLELDGDFDYETEVTVNELKSRYGLETNGIVDEEVWKLLLL